MTFGPHRPSSLRNEGLEFLRRAAPAKLPLIEGPALTLASPDAHDLPVDLSTTGLVCLSAPQPEPYRYIVYIAQYRRLRSVVGSG